MKFRGLILCTFLFVLALPAGGVASALAARTTAHKRVHHKKKHWSVMPYMGPLPNPSLFGVNTGTFDTNYSYFQRDIPAARGAGARWVHFTGNWVHFYRNGQPNWTLMDNEMTQARKLGLGVLLSLGGTPRACSRSRTSASRCAPTTNRDLTAYASFLRAELLRYRNDVQYYESWLEPNQGGYTSHGASPQDYANLLRTQYGVFQSVNAAYHTQLKLIFGGPISFGTAPGSGGPVAVLPFVNDVLNDLHGARVFDAIGLHGYRFPSNNNGSADENWGPSAALWDYLGGLGSFGVPGCSSSAAWCQMTWSQELRAYEQEFANHGYGQMPLWLTEFGWPGNANPSTALYPSFDSQARYLTDAYNDILGLPFIQGAFWFNSRDYKPGIASSDPAFFFHYGLFQYDFTPKPALSAFEGLAQANPGR